MLSADGSEDAEVPAGGFITARTRRERLSRLTTRDAGRGIQAAVYLPIAAIILDRWGLQRVQRQLLAWSRRPRSQAMSSDLALDSARRLAWVVDGVARRGPWKANCLQRSLVLWWFLGRRGLESDLRIGVRRRPGSAGGSRVLDFHAWVEYGGIVLNDRADIREVFATFERAIAPIDARWR